MDTPVDENQPDKNKKFPENRSDLDNKVKQANFLITQIDEQIKNPQKDKGPQPSLVPKGAPRSVQKITDIYELKKEKENVIDNTLNVVDRGLRGANKKAAKSYRGNALENLDPNQYKGRSPEDLKKAQSEKKDINTSQKVADTLLQNQKAKNVLEKEKGANTKEDNASSKSSRFTNTLAYSKFKENADSITKNADKVQPAKSNEKDKSMSMSERFTQSLGYPKMRSGFSINNDKEVNKSPNKGDNSMDKGKE